MVNFLDQVYGHPDADATKKALTIHKNRTEAIFKRLSTERFVTGRPEMGDDFRVSAWEAFNAIQGYTQHDARSKAGFKGEFDRILRASSDANVLRAESLVMQLVA